MTVMAVFLFLSLFQLVGGTDKAVVDLVDSKTLTVEELQPSVIYLPELIFVDESESK
ncbi:hypothetical protein [Treponema endosymbiont of Eucomonympha sp.]|uniref:hypothetical protein n=1 Tax=Treponema endosymbiont of Eucomonympha sp. TaxID=1580831 RepID=UPI000B1C7456|nr:hypothetical protein [Treponema endosymbiont of Eucomonympha sp.]